MPQINYCELCKKSFSKLSNLRAHANKFHPDKAVEIAPKKQVKVIAVCKECSKTFSKYESLRAHAKKFHPDKAVEIAPKKQFKVIAVCKECSKTFSKYESLRAHAKKFHPDKAAEIAPKKQLRVTEYYCKECSKTFSNYRNYIRHVNNFHNDKKSTVTCEKVFKFKCAVCQKNFSHLRHFKFHSKMHQQTSVNSHHRVLKKCPLCEYAEFSSQQLLDHFQSLHELTIHSEELEFSSFEEFMQWKTDVEKKDCVSFTNMAGIRRNCNSSQRIYYRCHRSGIFKTKGQSIRHLKTQGSNKINGYCPSQIKLIISKSGNCKVTWTKTHIGHDTDIRHLKLTSDEKEQLACKIASKIPFNTILDEIRDSVSNCDLERLHLLTRKDLYNIERCFNLNNSSVRHKNDAPTIESWEEQRIIKAISNNRDKVVSEETFKIRKEKLKAHFLQVVDDLESMMELEAVKSCITPIQPTVMAIRMQANERVAFALKSTPSSSNKNITPQGRLFKTKKTEKKIESKKNLTKPDIKELGVSQNTSE